MAEPQHWTLAESPEIRRCDAEFGGRSGGVDVRHCTRPVTHLGPHADLYSKPPEAPVTDPQQYRKKPVVVEAVRYDGDVVVARSRPQTPKALREFAGSAVSMVQVGSVSHGGGHQWLPVIRTKEGTMRVDPGDWIIRGVAGEFYPCKPDIFDATYEPVTSDD